MSWLVIKKVISEYYAYYEHDPTGIENVTINIFRYETEEDALNKAYVLAGGDPKKKYKNKRKGKVVYKSSGNYTTKGHYSTTSISCVNCPIHTDYTSPSNVSIEIDNC
tara:strand:+ start:130 stop:453 length:324 start_codon:yes stop_codon:yes gene_type:complete